MRGLRGGWRWGGEERAGPGAGSEGLGVLREVERVGVGSSGLS